MNTTTLLLSLCFSIATLAQNYDFGKVSREELDEKYNPLDSTAVASYIYKSRKTYFEYLGSDFQLVTDVHERIKIYKKEGFDFANKEVLLYKNNGNREKLSGLRGVTYNLVDDKIVEVKLGNDGIFDSEYNKNRDLKKFTLSNIKEGSVLEIKYKIVSPYFFNVEEYVFQHEIPIMKLEAKFEAPEYFNFKLNTKGFLPITPINSKSNDPAGFSNNVTTYELSNIPGLKDESYVNNINNYRSSVSYELSYVSIPHQQPKYYSTGWEDVVKTIYESSNFGLELDKTGYFEVDIDALISSVLDPMARAALIFNFVKTKIRWNGYNGISCNDGVRKAYKDQVGNIAEINLMLTAMLRHAGLNANPVLVSTRQNGIPLFPTIEGFDYVVACIETDQGAILLDASNKYSMPNILPTKVLNWEGRIIRKNKSSSTISLYPNEPSKNTITMMANLDVNGNIEGNYRSIKTNHVAMLYREDYLETDKSQFLNNLENKYIGMEISDYEVKNDYNLSEPITESYKFLLESQADVIGDKLYFSPMFFLKTNENPFKLEKREFPVDFGTPSETAYRIVINLPEGYKIENMPEPAALMMPDNLAEFKYNVSGNERNIQVIVSTKINKPIISPLYYSNLKEYFNRFIEKEAEQIVLVKN